MKKIDVKKCLLYVSLAPYVFVLLISIYHSIFGFDYNIQGYEPLYGIRGAIAFVDSFWEYNFFFNFILLILCVSYQSYYLISFKKSEMKNDNENAYKVKSIIGIQKLLFSISMICWTIYLMTGIYAFFAGASGGLLNATKIYGMEALGETLFWNGLAFSIVPVLPVTLIYIVVYLIVKYREKRKSKLKVNKKV